MGTMELTAAFRMDSWAPMPTPHRAMPTSREATECPANTKMAKGADSIVLHTRARTPFLSYSSPKNRAATASTSMAPAYSSGSVPLEIRLPVSCRPAATPVKVRETCMMMME